LPPEQKQKLEKIRNATISEVKVIAQEAKSLKKGIVKAARSGAKPETLYGDVDKLAALKAKATKVQLDCMSQTRAILTKEQLDYLHRSMKKHRKKKKKK
jgi:hypothetical protein